MEKAAKAAAAAAAAAAEGEVIDVDADDDDSQGGKPKGKRPRQDCEEASDPKRCRVEEPERASASHPGSTKITSKRLRVCALASPRYALH
jgi:hypothetical protein